MASNAPQGEHRPAETGDEAAHRFLHDVALSVLSPPLVVSIETALQHQLDLVDEPRWPA